MFKCAVSLDMPKQGKKYNVLEQNAEVKNRTGDMLQHAKGFRKRKKNLVRLQPARLRNIGYLYAFIPNGFNTEVGSIFIM